jgi:hypothetical protein
MVFGLMGGLARPPREEANGLRTVFYTYCEYLNFRPADLISCG